MKDLCNLMMMIIMANAYYTLCINHRNNTLPMLFHLILTQPMKCSIFDHLEEAISTLWFFFNIQMKKGKNAAKSATAWCFLVTSNFYFVLVESALVSYQPLVVCKLFSMFQKIQNFSCLQLHGSVCGKQSFCCISVTKWTQFQLPVGIFISWIL